MSDQPTQLTQAEINAAFAELDEAILIMDDTTRMPNVNVHAILQGELARLDSLCQVQQVSITMFEKMLVAIAEIHPETIPTIQRLTAIANEVIDEHTGGK